MPSRMSSSPLVTHGMFALRAAERKRRQAATIFNLYFSGKSYAEIGVSQKVSAEEVRKLISYHVRSLWDVAQKWKAAEMRCHAMAMELRLLRLGKEAPPDQPLKTLRPPKRWLKAFEGAEIETVNQLRSVDGEMLLARYRFPVQAIHWAILTLDKKGLSHRLDKKKNLLRALHPPRYQGIVWKHRRPRPQQKASPAD